MLPKAADCHSLIARALQTRPLGNPPQCCHLSLPVEARRQWKNPRNWLGCEGGEIREEIAGAVR